MTYIFGAICPAEGKAAGLVLPWCNTQAMNLHLAKIAAQVAPGRHAALLMDQAGWHMFRACRAAPGGDRGIRAGVAVRPAVTEARAAREQAGVCRRRWRSQASRGGVLDSIGPDVRSIQFWQIREWDQIRVQILAAVFMLASAASAVSATKPAPKPRGPLPPLNKYDGEHGFPYDIPCPNLQRNSDGSWEIVGEAGQYDYLEGAKIRDAGETAIWDKKCPVK